VGVFLTSVYYIFSFNLFSFLDETGGLGTNRKIKTFFTLLSFIFEGLLRMRFFKKFQDWILKSKYGFCVTLLNSEINSRSPGLWCIKETEESTLGKDSSVPLIYNDLSDRRENFIFEFRI